MNTPEPAELSPPDVAAIAAQNDAFRRFACLGIAPDQPIQGRLVVGVGKTWGCLCKLVIH